MLRCDEVEVPELVHPGKKDPSRRSVLLLLTCLKFTNFFCIVSRDRRRPSKFPVIKRSAFCLAIFRVTARTSLGDGAESPAGEAIDTSLGGDTDAPKGE
jgi:hypothetical protein